VTPSPAAGAKAPAATLTVLVYSDDRTARAQILRALGRRPAPELPALRYLESATLPAVLGHMDAGGVDLAILDGEAVPAGGMGVCRQLKDEIYHCPPILVITGRPQDAWLATWSRADGVVPRPIDPMVLADTTAALLRQRLAGLPVR
jgi:DNA-binding response OmpR family regulator